MSIVAIPSWNAQGVLPPIDPSMPASPTRSPYAVSLLDVVMRFAITRQRAEILMGLLNYRAALHQLRLTSGFQWLDGSFFENVELLESRAPNDIDVVTFVNTPANFTPAAGNAALFDQQAAKRQFKVDAYFVELNQLTPTQLTEQSAYWYSMWSHRRNQTWKGYLRIELAPAEDSSTLAWLAHTLSSGALP